MSGAMGDLSIGQAAATGYFVDQKKGEVNELKQLLKNLNIEKDIRRKREVIKKVIAYMTLGIDVSRLFTDMIMAIETRDIVLKKMIYLYLCNYAKAEPEMAIMCINSLRRDCENEDPLVRGLALRSLCNLKLESILEYVDRPLQKCLTDVSGYVRKTAVLGVLKIFQLSPALVETNGYVEQLYRMLQDPDANVVINIIHVLNELKIQEGGFEITQSNIMMLLNRIGEFTEWGLNTVLDLVARYRPTSDDELFAIMNLLDPVLRTANSGSVLATLKCFLQLSTTCSATLPAEMQAQIIARSKPPLLTLITGGSAEVQYVTLQHVHCLLSALPNVVKGIFDDEFRQFFVRYNEVPHVKHLKVDVLPRIANAVNARDISMELCEYVTDVDSELSRRAIHALAQLAISIAPVCEEMVRQILSFLDIDNPYIRSESAVVLADVVRVHPHLSPLVLPYVGKYLVKRVVDDAPAKAAMVWMLGEFGGSQILEAPYILEQLIDAYHEETSVDVKLAMLTAAMKLFFQRPPEMQAMLGRLLQAALVDENSGNQDVHDRALFCYRLLRQDVQGSTSSSAPLAVAESVFAVGAATRVGSEGGGDFAEKKDEIVQRKIFQEFNSLAVTFQMPSEQFIEEKYQLKYDRAPLSDFDVVVPNAHNKLLPASTGQEMAGNPSTAAAQSSSSPSSSSAAGVVVGSVNLLDWEDDVKPTPPTSSSSSSSSTALALQEVSADFMSPPVFQQHWMSWPEVFQGVLCRCQRLPTSTVEVENLFRAARLFVMASGVLPNNSGMKFFVYSLDQQQTLFLAQVVVTAQTGEFSVTAKTEGMHAGKMPLFLNHVLATIAPVFQAIQ